MSPGLSPYWPAVTALCDDDAGQLASLLIAGVPLPREIGVILGFALQRGMAEKKPKGQQRKTKPKHARKADAPAETTVDLPFKLTVATKRGRPSSNHFIRNVRIAAIVEDNKAAMGYESAVQMAGKCLAVGEKNVEAIHKKNRALAAEWREFESETKALAALRDNDLADPPPAVASWMLHGRPICGDQSQRGCGRGANEKAASQTRTGGITEKMTAAPPGSGRAATGGHAARSGAAS